MRHDSTGVRISLYFALVCLTGGDVELARHFHKLNAVGVSAAILLALLTVAGFVVVVTWTEKMPLKLVSEPLTAAGVLISAVGCFFSPYSWIQIGLSFLVLAVFGATLYEEKQSIEQEKKLREAVAAKAARTAAEEAKGLT